MKYLIRYYKELSTPAKALLPLLLAVIVSIIGTIDFLGSIEILNEMGDAANTSEELYLVREYNEKISKDFFIYTFICNILMFIAIAIYVKDIIKIQLDVYFTKRLMKLFGHKL